MIFIPRSAAYAQTQRNSVRGRAYERHNFEAPNGIGLPNVATQEALLDRIYAHSRIDSDRPAFVEAHSIGTPVGDSAEAIGRSIGPKRSLPIVSNQTSFVANQHLNWQARWKLYPSGRDVAVGTRFGVDQNRADA